MLCYLLFFIFFVTAVGEPEWGGRSSAGAVCKRTDERGAIDKRVKEMKEKREDPSVMFLN